MSGDHIIFVCMGNITRSPMAAEVFRQKMLARQFDCKVESAGILDLGFSGRAAPEWRTVELAKRYDLSAHQRRYLGVVPFTPKTFFACMEDVVLSDVRHWSGVSDERVYLFNPPNGVHDPSHGRGSFQDCFTQINTGVAKLMEALGLNR